VSEGRARLCQVAFQYISGKWTDQDFLPFLVAGESGLSGLTLGTRATPVAIPKPDTVFDLMLLAAASHSHASLALQFNTQLCVGASAP